MTYLNLKMVLNTVDNPTPEKIKQARLDAGLTLSQAAAMVHVNIRSWQKWEANERTMNMAAWELFLIKSEKSRQAIAIKSLV